MVCWCCLGVTVTSNTIPRGPGLNILFVDEFVMPSSNPLSFLRPLYDIAVWQFLLMFGCISQRSRTGQPDHLKFTYGMHEVVANFLCKLLEVQAVNHLQQNVLKTEAKVATGNWVIGQQATKELVQWCQDQWRRKNPCLRESATAYAVNDPLSVAWYENIPLCYNCGIPCPNCREEMGTEAPAEMSTVRALLDYENIHASTIREDEDDPIGMQQEPESGGVPPEDRETPQTPPQPRVRLRPRKVAKLK